MFQRTTATNKLLKLTKRIRGVSGGTSASKTISILMILVDYAQNTENELISVVSETYPHLRRGAILDFKNIMHQQGYWKDASWNKTESTYTFDKGTKMEFFSADASEKVKGPRRDILFVNEANNISFETFTQLEIRTRKVVWLDWNPVAEFWWYTDILPTTDVDFITLTYKDNEALEPSIVASIEAKQHLKNFWQVYGLGELGTSEGRIYAGWQQIDEVPHEARLERYGLDFGYTNDPSALVAVYKYNGGIILDEQLYRKGMSNKQLADVINTLPFAVVVADSSEPKSIDEIASYGITILPAVKGQGSVNQGIQYVQDQKISVTKNSTALLKEYRNYLWMSDKNGKIINEPEQAGLDNALDAVRYALTNIKSIGYEEEIEKPDWAHERPSWVK